MSISEQKSDHLHDKTITNSNFNNTIVYNHENNQHFENETETEN